MRIFNNPYEMTREVERDLFEMGIRVQSYTMQDKFVGDDSGYETVELQAYGYMITNVQSDQYLDAIKYLEGDIEWANAEFEDRISPRHLNPGFAWTATKKMRKIWSEFMHDGKFSYTYNERFRSQLNKTVDELTVHPNTRQAILTVYDKCQDMQNWGGKARIPCSLHYQFYARDGKLHCIYSMRSCDFLTHFIHDSYLAVRLLEHVALQTGNEVGNLTHFMGSLHAYQKDMTERGIF